jgi:hypothetical protein
LTHQGLSNKTNNAPISNVVFNFDFIYISLKKWFNNEALWFEKSQIDKQNKTKQPCFTDRWEMFHEVSKFFFEKFKL